MLRFFIFCLYFVGFVLENYLKRIIYIFSKTQRLKSSSRILSRYSKRMMKLLNICNPHNYDISPNGLFIVSNHVSYLDIFVLSSIKPALFITSNEVKQHKFLGFLAKHTDAIFVERRNRTSVQKDIKRIHNYVKRGLNVVLFAEGTSTNADSVLPFKSALFAAVEKTRTFVVPITINYIFLDDELVRKSNRDRIFYYGDMFFGPHFMKLFDTKYMIVEVIVNDPVLAEEHNRKELANLTHAKISAKLREMK